jgi:metal-responsive CopG/Arc/MetJ family transcriptional regulator
MATVQIVLDKELLQAADEAARRTNQSRSALVREALRQHLRKLEIHALEEQERAGYLRIPEDLTDSGLWAAAWPED